MLLVSEPNTITTAVISTWHVSTPDLSEASATLQRPPTCSYKQCRIICTESSIHLQSIGIRLVRGKTFIIC